MLLLYVIHCIILPVRFTTLQVSVKMISLVPGVNDHVAIESAVGANTEAP